MYQDKNNLLEENLTDNVFGAGNLQVALISLFGLDFGLRSISSLLKKNGYCSSLIFFNKHSYSAEFLGNDYFTPRLLNHEMCSKDDLDLLIFLLKKIKPSIIGISVSSVTMQAAKRITCRIKEHFDTIIVWGGIHAIIAPEECIQHADIVCVGEGEFPMLELAKKVKHRHLITGINNLWIKRDGFIEKNRMNDLMVNLDILPFPDFIDENNKFLIDRGRLGREVIVNSASEKDVYPIMTSRGCMFSCSFCCNSVIRKRYQGKGPYLRRRSVGNVITELKLAIMSGWRIRTIRFWDDIFTYDSQWIEEFCPRYLHEIGKPFNCYVHPKSTSRNMLCRLKEVGLNRAIIGIQTGSEEVASQFFSRNQSNQDILDFSYFVKQQGIRLRFDLIVDNPYENESDHNIAVELLLKLPTPFQIQIYSLCWFPKTPLTKRAILNNVISEKDLEQYTFKALNNFHLQIPLFKDKYNLFWNCIIAMSVNRKFSKHWVRLCKKNNFFRKYPYVLFLLSKYYLILLTRFEIKWQRNRIFIIKMLEHSLVNDVAYISRHTASQRFIIGGAESLFIQRKIKYSFFPLNSSTRSKKFCLRVKQHKKSEVFNMAVYVVYSPLSIGFVAGAD